MMTNPINAHCLRAMEYMRKLKEQAESINGHDPGDEDPRAWDSQLEND